jgi:hypothetical protein
VHDGFYVGAHVASLDAQAAIATIEPLYQLSTQPPAAGASDARVFPWRYPRDNYVDLQFGVSPRTVRRSGAASHGWGAPLIRFRDTTTGIPLDVSMLTYATFHAGDFVGARDPVTGGVLVSTTMGENTLFGRTLAGSFIPCSGNGACDVATALPVDFDFRITAADFAKVIGLARASNPALSVNSADYILVNFRFRHGVLNDADVGAALTNLRLGVFGY